LLGADYFRTLYDYTYWARDRILKAAEGLTEEEYAKPNGFNYGSIRGILNHALASEAGAISRWTGVASAGPANEMTLPTLDALVARWREEESKLQPFLSKLKDEDLDGEVVSRRQSGEEFRRPLYVDLTQIANHATQHRSEAAEALTMVGRSPGDLDFTVYYRERLSARSPSS
jgi:uncharacterized damage-inducible protein DinB